MLALHLFGLALNTRYETDQGKGPFINAAGKQYAKTFESVDDIVQNESKMQINVSRISKRQRWM